MKNSSRGSDSPAASLGLLDTSVVVDLDTIAPSSLPAVSFISTLTLAELAAGPHAAADPTVRATRQALLQTVEASMAALVFDEVAARAFGRLYAAVAGTGRKTRGRRSVDLLIAATALAHNMPLFTRNPSDFKGLEDLIEVIAV